MQVGDTVEVEIEGIGVLDERGGRDGWPDGSGPVPASPRRPPATCTSGNARTALFNWLFARHHGGTFVLRIEDTDAKRSTDEAIAIVLDSLRWLGLDWDEGPEVGGPFGPYRQTRADATSTARPRERFLASGRAYHCYCTPEELEDRRRAALKRGETPGYDGRCRNLTDEERARVRGARAGRRRCGSPCRAPTSPCHDLIRGDTHFPANDLRDFVIMRSDGTPTYLLAAAVDDVAMQMTHVIRGEDLLPSTPAAARDHARRWARSRPRTPTSRSSWGRTASRCRSATAPSRWSGSRSRDPARGPGELPGAAGLVLRRDDHVLRPARSWSSASTWRVCRSNPAAFDPREARSG